MTEVIRLNQTISFDETMRRLIRKSQDQRSPFWHARYILHHGITIGAIRVFCDGNVVPPGMFSTTLYVNCDKEEKHTSVGTLRALVKPLHEYEWALSRIDVNNYIRTEKWKEWVR